MANNDFVTVPKASEDPYRKAQLDKQKALQIDNNSENKTKQGGGIVARLSKSLTKGLKNFAGVGNIAATGAINGISSVLASVAKVVAMAPAIAATVAVGIVSLIVGIVVSVVTSVQTVVPVTDYAKTIEYVAVGRAAIGNSNSETNLDVSKSMREMARRIWSAFGGFKKVKLDSSTSSSPIVGGEGGSVGEAEPGTYEEVGGVPTAADYAAYGLRPEKLCAVLGTWEAESHLDPTSVESVFDEPFRIGPVKQEGSIFDFQADYYWTEAENHAGEKGMYFKDRPKIYKAGIGLAQWTDTRPASDPSWKFDITNPGRNTKLITYAKLYGMEHYLTADKGWNSEDWIAGNSKTEGYWYDPKIQLAFALDTSDVGDTKASWLWKWAANNDTSIDVASADDDTVIENLMWGSSDTLTDFERVKFGTGDDNKREGWVADFAVGNMKVVPHGSYCAPDRTGIYGWYDIKIDVNDYDGNPAVELHAETDSFGNEGRAVGRNTKDIKNFENGGITDPRDLGLGMFSEDDEKVSSIGNHTGIDDLYYNSGSLFSSGTSFVNYVGYDKWDADKSLETDGDAWNHDDNHDNGYETTSAMNDLDKFHPSHFTSAVPTSSANLQYVARQVAYEYATRSADLAWHGRMNGVNGTTGVPTDAEASNLRSPSYYSKAGYNDFLCKVFEDYVIYAGLISHTDTHVEDDYQRWGIIETQYDTYGNPQWDIYGWIKVNDLPTVLNTEAMKRYKRCFRYIYRYHLYRYMTMYYTAEFAHDYEGTSDEGEIKKRQDNALKYFQAWWDASNNDGEAEPNVFSEKVKRPVGDCEAMSDPGFDDYFFKIEQGYAQGIQQGIARTQDELKDDQKLVKIYSYDADMKSNERTSFLNTNDIASSACMLAAQDASPAPDYVSECYKYVHDLVFNGGSNYGTPGAHEYHLTGDGDTIYKSCDRSACTAIRWSGMDDNFPGGNTLVQEEYLVSSPRWTEIDWGGDISQLQPGDVLIRKDSLAPGANFESDPTNAHHIMIYVGKNLAEKYWKTSGATTNWTNEFIVEGSFGDHGPKFSSFSGTSKKCSYHAFRCTSPMEPGKSQYKAIVFSG